MDDLPKLRTCPKIPCLPTSAPPWSNPNAQFATYSHHGLLGANLQTKCRPRPQIRSMGMP